MSFTIIEPATARLNRSELAVPGSRPELFEKAAKGDADVIFLDLEDAVAPDDKSQARKNVIEAINDIDWGNKTLSVRINGLDTHYMYRDVIDVIEQTKGRLDVFMIPKVGTPDDVYASICSRPRSRTPWGAIKRIGFELIIETALGMSNVESIAHASERNESLHFGVADYAASTKARMTTIGGPNPMYGVLTDIDGDKPRDYHWGDMWHFAISRMVVAARAAGLRPIDGPFGDFKDADGYRAPGQPCRRAGLRRQVGHSPQPDRHRQRGEQSFREGNHPGQTYSRSHGTGSEGWSGRGFARRTSDRYRLDQAGRSAGEQSRADCFCLIRAGRVKSESPALQT